jgi:hypothetical protein
MFATACGAVKSPSNPGDDDAGGGDVCPTGATCACSVATQATDCGTHEVCDTTSTPGRVCACAPAYAKDGTGACAFAGAPADPKMSDATVWAPVGTGASINATLPGNVDPGEAVINHDGLCGYAALSQTFTMPPLDRAEPFKLVVTHTGVEPQQQFDLSGSMLSIGVGNQWTDLAVPINVYRTDSICLGPAAYGGPIKFQVATLGGGGLTCSTGATSTSTVHVDQLVVQVAGPGECPMPGTVMNGNFETATGWTFTSVQGTATGTIVAGAGEDGSAGAQLVGTNRCSEEMMTGQVSMPTRAQIANPAVDLYWNGTSGERLVFQLGGKNIATLNATGTAGHSRVCVPAWAAGNATTIGLFMARHSDNACTTAYSQSFTIDNLTIVNEPACTATGDLTDPGFERVANLTGPVTGWGSLHDYVNDLQGLYTNALNSAGLAHAGNGSLRMIWDNPCTQFNSGGADFSLIVPAPSGGGPAVKFFANVPATNTMTEARVSLLPLPFGSTAYFTSPPTGAYAAHTLCLPPALAGRRITLRASLGDSGGGCAASNTSESAVFDDFSVTTDPACAAQ